MNTRLDYLFVRISLALLLLAGLPLLATNFSYPIDQLVDESELIVVAKPTGYIQGEWTTLDVDRRPIRGRQISVSASVIREIKGHCDRTITIRFVTDYRLLDDIHSGETQLLFLRPRGDVYLPANPRLMSLPAVAEAPTRLVSSGLQRVMEELGMVISSRDETALRNNLVFAAMLLGPPDRNFDQSLKAAYGTSDEHLRLQILVTLLSRNDISMLDEAKELLLRGTLQERNAEGLANAIGSLRNRGALPVLKELLNSPDPLARRAAVKAMRYSAGPSEVPALLHALDDDDVDVAMYAMFALGQITGDRGPVCSIDKFRHDRSDCVEPWRKLSRSYSNK